MTGTHVLGAAAAVLLAVGAAHAQNKVVYLKGGRQFTGEVTKTAEGNYQIKTGIGTVIISADQVLRVEEAITPADELKQRVARAGDNPDALYRVATWAREQKMLPQARDLFKKVLQLQPGHENAALVLKLVEMEIARSTAPDTHRSTTRESGTDTPAPVDRSQLLTMEDVYHIRLLELASNDRAAVEYRGDVLDRFIRSMEGRDMFARRNGERRFRRMPRVEQVMYILRNTKDTTIHDGIIIKTDPGVMKVFRQRIWPIIRTSCASARCHGGPKGAGAFKLFDLPMTDARVAYTNFYILQGWKDGGKRMIDRDVPASSLLLQCALPPRIAKPGLGHPEGGRRAQEAPFPSQKHPAYQAMDKWIRSLRVPLLPPGYRIRYKIPNMPTGTASTAPAPLGRPLE